MCRMLCDTYGAHMSVLRMHAVHHTAHAHNTFMHMHVAIRHLGLAGLAVHAALLALHSRAAVPAAGHGCVRAGQGQLMVQLGGWSQNPQGVMLQLLSHRQTPNQTTLSNTLVPRLACIMPAQMHVRLQEGWW